MKGQTHATTNIFWENDLSLVSSQVFDQVERVLVIFASLEKGQWGSRVLFYVTANHATANSSGLSLARRRNTVGRLPAGST